MKSILAPTDSGVQRHSCYLHIRSCFSLLLRKRVFGEWVTRDFYCPDAVPVTQATVTKALDETQSTDTRQESSSTGSLRPAFFIHSRRIPGERGVAPLRRLSDTAIFRRVWNAFSFCTWYRPVDQTFLSSLLSQNVRRYVRLF